MLIGRCPRWLNITCSSAKELINRFISLAKVANTANGNQREWTGDSSYKDKLSSF